MEKQNYTLTKLQKRSILIPLAIAIAFFMLCSCSARKVDKSKTVTKETAVIETTKKDSSKTVILTDTNTKIVDTGTEEEFTISPIDSTKEMVVSGKKYFNAKLRHKTTSKNKVVDNSVKVSETRQNDIKEASKSEISKSETIETKVTDKKQFNILSLWWVLLLIIGAVIYLRKYGFKLPFSTKV